jgi:hypothetical protein
MRPDRVSEPQGGGGIDLGAGPAVVRGRAQRARAAARRRRDRRGGARVARGGHGVGRARHARAPRRRTRDRRLARRARRRRWRLPRAARAQPRRLGRPRGARRRRRPRRRRLRRQRRRPTGRGGRGGLLSRARRPDLDGLRHGPQRVGAVGAGRPGRRLLRGPALAGLARGRATARARPGIHSYPPPWSQEGHQGEPHRGAVPLTEAWGVLLATARQLTRADPAARARPAPRAARRSCERTGSPRWPRRPR